ncbi:hypothetical protein V5T82_15100 [Magnetovibrio sp. PR-2]|uniref:hypothetical protein n=1 Tax=Magnetovibrio sp. PR-2 TaxID=3120356 RepID=UPI002FCE5C6B
MNNPIHILRHAGADQECVELLRGILDSGRYAYRDCERLASIIVGASGGPNRDSPLFELCHLMNGVDACGFVGNDRMAFVMGEVQVTPNALRQSMESRLDSTGWRRSEFTNDDAGIEINYPDGTFSVRYGRMPVLLALYEFLGGMNDFTFFTQLNDTFDTMLSAAPVSQKTVKAATGALAREFRKYRRQHIKRAEYEDSIQRISPFLTERAGSDGWQIDDLAILDFWLLHNQVKAFKGYATVFEKFVQLDQIMRQGRLSTDMDGARPLGLNREAGEVDVRADKALGPDDYKQWSSPLETFADEELQDIKFFKAKTESGPLQGLMRYGPHASQWPLSFMRVESFDPIQSAISNDLRMKRGPQSVRQRITCDAAIPYHEKAQQFDAAQSHVKKLQQAVLYILSNRGEQIREAIDGNDMESESLLGHARKAFESLKRKGFDQSAFDEENRMVFEEAADALVAISNQLHAFLNKIQFNKHEGQTALSNQFEEDRGVFRMQFEELYGDVS